MALIAALCATKAVARHQNRVSRSAACASARRCADIARGAAGASLAGRRTTRACSGTAIAA
jgi:hypothetical protein